MRKPWPDGPRARVDEAFQNVVLETAAVRELCRVRPSIAREVVLATLIEEPREEGWSGHSLRGMDFDVVERHGWLPALYMTGPFLLCLRENFTEGLSR